MHFAQRYSDFPSIKLLLFSLKLLVNGTILHWSVPDIALIKYVFAKHDLLDLLCCSNINIFEHFQSRTGISVGEHKEK